MKVTANHMIFVEKKKEKRRKKEKKILVEGNEKKTESQRESVEDCKSVWL